MTSTHMSQRYSINREWMDSIPKHWEIKRIKYLFDINKRIAGDTTRDVLSITQQGIKIKDISSGQGQLSSDYSKYQIVETNDFAMNHMDLLTGFIDIASSEGVTSPDYRVFSIKNDKYNKRYFLYIFQLMYHNRIFYPLGQGSSHLGRWRLQADAFNSIYLPIPPVTEQNIIVDHIEEELSYIDDLISKQRLQIELTLEKADSLIAIAVTRGINSNVETKKVRSNWINEIPSNWELIRLRYLASIKTGGRDTKDADPDGEYDFYVRSQKSMKIDTYSAECEAVLTAGDGAGVGKIFHYTIGKKFDFHQRVYMIHDFKKISGKYIYYYLKSNFYKVALGGQAKSTVDSVRLPWLKNFQVAVPPPNEQEIIINYIEKELANVSSTIAKINEELVLLKERRLSVIYFCVTGKK